MQVRTAQAIVLLATLLAPSAHARTPDEIQRRGEEILEESRKSFGHWVPVNSPSGVDHLQEHLGKNGAAVCAFFLSSELYATNSPSIAEQERDTAFVAFKSLAREQHEWMERAGLAKGKTWSFGFSHSSDTAEVAGCELGSGNGVHLCLVIWRTSEDGKELRTERRAWAQPPTKAAIQGAILQHLHSSTG